MNFHFKNLTAIRFFAVSAVIIFHIETAKHDFGLASRYNDPHFYLLSKLGVCLFFVLSGFLITSLLVKEKEQFGSINIKKFYVRRILRIWPLYYLLIILTLYILPKIPGFYLPTWYNPYSDLTGNSVFMLFILPNVQVAIFGYIPFAAQAWSIGVEEQFYIFWPFVVKRFKELRQLKLFIIGFIALFAAFKLLLLMGARWYHRESLYQLYLFLSTKLQLNCMMYGALFSIINLNNEEKRKYTSKPVQIIFLSAVVIFFLPGSMYKHFVWDLYSVLFGGIILNLVNKTSILNIDNFLLNYLGKISYSIYMLHPLIIALILKAGVSSNFYLFISSFAVSILVSSLCYEYFEKKFLRVKVRYEKVKSRS